ncbi:MAG: YfcE family phosphodiesterase [Coriobacteriia bacterium]
MSAEEPSTARIGVISDTHGRLGTEALEALAGVDHIIHAGDIGNPSILMELEAIAPVTAVLGNGDSALAVFGLRPVERVVIAGIRFLVVHVPADVVRPQDVDVVITGHTHKPQVHRYGCVLYVNPGSPSRSRGDGHTIALIDIADGRAEARIVPLDRA